MCRGAGREGRNVCVLVDLELFDEYVKQREKHVNDDYTFMYIYVYMYTYICIRI